MDPNALFKYRIESREDCHTFLIPPSASKDWLPWFGAERAKAFAPLSIHANARSDLDGRDRFYWHMLIMDPQTNNLIGAQRFQFVNETNKPTDHESYLEHCYPGLAEQMVSNCMSYVEVGRTFLMPAYQGKFWLKELIRGFARIPEQRGFQNVLGMISFNHLALKQIAINNFLEALNRCQFRGNLPIPKPRYAYPIEKPSKTLEWNQLGLPGLKKKLKAIDHAFELPPVLSPYRTFCSVKYEGVSIATSYNQILQLMFSGRTDLLSPRQRKWLPSYALLNEIPYG